MELEVAFKGEFTKDQIRRVSEVHPELGVALKLAHFDGGGTAVRRYRKSVGNHKKAVPDDSLWRIGDPAKTLNLDTQNGKAIQKLVKDFGDEPFFYQNVKEACAFLELPNSTPSHLRYNDLIVRVDD